MKSFKNWNDAHDYAIQISTECQNDVAIRKVKEFGTNIRYNVGFASRNDSDYAMAEIVRPNTPRTNLK